MSGTYAHPGAETDVELGRTSMRFMARAVVELQNSGRDRYFAVSFSAILTWMGFQKLMAFHMQATASITTGVVPGVFVSAAR